MPARSLSLAGGSTRARPRSARPCAKPRRSSRSTPTLVQILGEADPYRTVTGYGVTPVVGLVPPDLDLTPNPAEVADWFEAPLDFVLDPANQRRMTAEYKGRTRHYYQIDWQGRPIWGATAAMLVNLTRRIA